VLRGAFRRGGQRVDGDVAGVQPAAELLAEHVLRAVGEVEPGGHHHDPEAGVGHAAAGHRPAGSRVGEDPQQGRREHAEREAREHPRRFQQQAVA
jgi:hypothetical protein